MALSCLQALYIRYQLGAQSQYMGIPPEYGYGSFPQNFNWAASFQPYQPQPPDNGACAAQPLQAQHQNSLLVGQSSRSSSLCSAPTMPSPALEKLRQEHEVSRREKEVSRRESENTRRGSENTRRERDNTRRESENTRREGEVTLRESEVNRRERESLKKLDRLPQELGDARQQTDGKKVLPQQERQQGQIQQGREHVRNEPKKRGRRAGTNDDYYAEKHRNERDDARQRRDREGRGGRGNRFRPY